MTKYVIDSSSLDELETKYPINIPVFDPIYDKLNQMFEEGDLFSVKEVFEELRDLQEYWKIMRNVLENSQKKNQKMCLK